jgi:hypothetical protein
LVGGGEESSDQEVTSPLKKTQEVSAAGGDSDDVPKKASGAKGVLFLEGEADGTAGGRETVGNPNVNSAMQIAHVEVADGSKGSELKGSEMRKKIGKYKKVQRSGGGGQVVVKGVHQPLKRRVLTVETHNNLQSVSVRTYTFFTTG